MSPPGEGDKPGEDVRHLMVLVPADVNHEMAAFGGDVPQVGGGTDHQMDLSRLALNHEQGRYGETGSIRPGPGGDDGHPGGEPAPKPARLLPICRIGLERVLRMDHPGTLGKSVRPTGR